jgi:hypothetical protein
VNDLPARTSCDGRHVCDPPSYPTELGQSWDCPECGAHHDAFDVHAAYARDPLQKRLLEHVPAGTLGWRTVS